MKLNDTIAAIATPAGEGGIGVIRVSGPASTEIIRRIFRPAGKTAGGLESHRLYYGRLIDDAGEIDEVCVTVMKAPRSYTRQDSAEISCHGSSAVLRRALKAALAGGARMAEPGEFTKRAFLNGRIDLSQAEGVIDLIKARSEGAANAAFHLMRGGLSSRIDTVKRKLLYLFSHLEASIDFPDEELETAPDETLASGMNEALKKMEWLIKSYETGKFLKHGMGLVIIGKPNVGKSSLLNALLEEDRAIVTHHPGTTRDTIRAETELAGLPVELIDTAGLSDAPGEVEAIGMERALQAAETADVVIGLFDGSREWEKADEKVLDRLKKARACLAVINKSDLPKKLEWPASAPPCVRISVKERAGLEELLGKIRDSARSAGEVSLEEPLVTRTRHLEIFRRIAGDIKRAIEDLPLGRELSAASVWDALEEIKRFTGESYTEEVLSVIFDEFCIGK
jgi:tRNA modification GTPase